MHAPGPPYTVSLPRFLRHLRAFNVSICSFKFKVSYNLAAWHRFLKTLTCHQRGNLGESWSRGQACRLSIHMASDVSLGTCTTCK